MQITPDTARGRLLDLFLARENYKAQMKVVEVEIRDLRNYIAGCDAVAPAAAPTTEEVKEN